MKKRRVLSLLIFGIFSASCGNPSTSLDTSATNDIDYYWDAIQYDPSPNGYARFQDGWYQGEYVSDDLRLTPDDPSQFFVSHSRQKVTFQMDWPQDDITESHVLYPRGRVTAAKAYYHYEQWDLTEAGLTSWTAIRSLSASNGRFSFDQTIIRVEGSLETIETRQFYGPFDGFDLLTPWEHVYLQQSKFGTYSFSKETSTLNHWKKASSSECTNYDTSFRFSPDLYAIQSINGKWDWKTIEKIRVESSVRMESSARFTAEASQGSYSFSLLDEAPDIEVQEGGEKREKFPFNVIWLASDVGPCLD